MAAAVRLSAWTCPRRAPHPGFCVEGRPCRGRGLGQQPPQAAPLPSAAALDRRLPVGTGLFPAALPPRAVGGP